MKVFLEKHDPVDVGDVADIDIDFNRVDANVVRIVLVTNQDNNGYVLFGRLMDLPNYPTIDEIKFIQEEIGVEVTLKNTTFTAVELDNGNVVLEFESSFASQRNIQENV